MRSWPARPSPHGPVSAAFRRRPGRPRPPPVPIHSNPGPPFPARPGAQAGLFRPGPGHKPAFNDGHLRVIRSHLRRAAAYPGAAAYLPPPPPSPVAHPACDEQDVVVVRDQPSTPSPPPAPPRTASPTGPRIHLVPPAFHPPPPSISPPSTAPPFPESLGKRTRPGCILPFRYLRLTRVFRSRGSGGGRRPENGRDSGKMTVRAVRGRRSLKRRRFFRFQPCPASRNPDPQVQGTGTGLTVRLKKKSAWGTESEVMYHRYL